jgi:hypothetical protein
VADYFTRLYAPGEVTVQNRPLFEALNHLADTMRLRWVRDKASGWLQFRSASFFNDRIKEVPNRLLFRWAASRKEHGALTLDDLIEIAQLSDPQLDSRNMAEGAKTVWELEEWDLARNIYGLRPYLRYLAEFTAAQRQQVQSTSGLPLTRMTLGQQQGYISLALNQQAGPRASSLEELEGAMLRVDYAVPGMYEWERPVASGEPGWRSLLLTPVREQSREAALAAARRVDAQAGVTQIVPTEPALSLIFTWGRPETRLGAHVVRATRTSARLVSWTKAGNSQSTDDTTRSE